MIQQENILARYKVLHELGRGATGAVYAAQERATGATVALKRLDPALLSADRSFAARFLKHAHAARLLKHRNIIRIHDAGEAAGTAYVAMEMLEGESLRKMLDAGPLPIARAIRIAHHVASGLAHAHLEGVVHGGLRPSNIMILRAGLAKITDFGTGQAATASAAPAECLRYMSPEQVRGEPVDHRCDIFALGALFYEMLTHRPAFEGDSAQQIKENILHAEPPRPSELNQHVPPALDGVVASMLAKQPAVRMPGAPILLSELQRLEEALGLSAGAIAATEEPAASEPPARPARLRTEPLPAEEFGRREPILDRGGFDHLQAELMAERERGPARPSGWGAAIFAGLAVALLLAIGGAGLIYFSSGGNELGIAANRMQATPPAVASAPPPSTAAPVAQAAKEPAAAPAPLPAPQAVAPRAVEPVAPKPPVAQTQAPVAQAEPPAAVPSPVAQAESPAPRVAEEPKPASVAAAPIQKLPRTKQPVAKAPEQPAGTARLILAVSPSGEIYIDDKHHGTTPPMTSFELEPGMHRIEVRSGSRKPYLTYITVQPGDVRHIRHDFNAKPIRPPA